jgi:hypothetical protein
VHVLLYCLYRYKIHGEIITEVRLKCNQGIKEEMKGKEGREKKEGQGGTEGEEGTEGEGGTEGGKE